MSFFLIWLPLSFLIVSPKWYTMWGAKFTSWTDPTEHSQETAWGLFECCQTPLKSSTGLVAGQARNSTYAPQVYVLVSYVVNSCWQELWAQQQLLCSQTVVSSSLGEISLITGAVF